VQRSWPTACRRPMGQGAGKKLAPARRPKAGRSKKAWKLPHLAREQPFASGRRLNKQAKPDLRQSNPGRQCHHKSTHSVWFSVWLMTLEGTTAHAAAFPAWCGVWEGSWAWSKSLLPLAASLRSGLRKTSVQAGDAGPVFSACLASRFGSTRHGRPNNGAFSACARSTRTPGREAFGPTGSVPAFRPGSITVGQRRAGWNSAKPDDTWPATRRRANCRSQLPPLQWQTCYHCR